MKNKKILIVGLIVILAIFVIIAIITILTNEKEKPEEIFNSYISKINEKNYEEMYELLTDDSKSKISREDFVTKNKNIYEGIDALNIKVDITETQKENKNVKLSYNQEMNTSAGTVEFSNSINLVKVEDTYKIDWSTTLIHPDLKEGYKVRVKTLQGSRGIIMDRYGNDLATNGVVSQVGIVPGKLGDNKDASISKIS